MPFRLQTIQEFFTDDPKCEQVVQCLYGLNDLEFQLYCSLLCLEKSDVTNLIEHTGREDRVIINRALQKLMNEGLCTRDKLSQKGTRGYKFVYSPKSIPELKDELLNKVENWYQEALVQIENIEHKFESKHSQN